MSTVDNDDFMVHVKFTVEAHGTYQVRAGSHDGAIEHAAAVARERLVPLPEGLRWVCVEVHTERMGPSRKIRGPVVTEIEWNDGTGS